MRRRMRYDAIIYDWNGTLIDDVGISHTILCSLLDEYGLDRVDIESYKQAFTFPVRKYYEHVGFDFSKYTFEEVAAKYVPLYDKHYKECKIFDDAVALITKLRKYGIKQYLLSATQRDALLEQTNFFGVTDLFDLIIGTDNFHGKSKTEEAKELLDKEHLAGKKMLLVGDTEYDFDVAKTIGADVVLCGFGHRPENELKKLTKKVILSYKDLEKIILN